MARRKRLTPLGLSEAETDEAPRAATGMAPVARIAADSATRAALEDLAEEMRQARKDGRMIITLPLEQIELQHLTRDRLSFDVEDMAALMASILARGQQTPIEVVALDGGRYGLISGARRLTALRQLHDQTGDPAFARIKALLRSPAAATDAYLAMVEENEIRSNLSFYERGRLAHEAARLGVFDSAAAAVRALFVHVSASKRSKILNFVELHDTLGSALRFPEAIPEKLGLALVKEIRQAPSLREEIIRHLTETPPRSVAEERSILDRVRRMPPPSEKLTPERRGNAKDQYITVTGGTGRLILIGPGVTARLIDDLKRWLADRR